MLPWTQPTQHPKPHLGRFSRFAQLTAESPYFTMGRYSPTSLPSKLPIRMGDLDPHLMHDFLGPQNSITQAASRSVNGFFAGFTTVTDRPTDRAKSVTIGRIYVRSAVIRPKKPGGGRPDGQTRYAVFMTQRCLQTLDLLH